MAKSIAVTEQCPMEIGLNVLSGKWKLKILWQVSKGAVRFNELHRLLGKITTKTLTQQLRELEEQKILARTVYPDNPPKVEYTLTDLGQSIHPVLKSLCDWGTAYQAAIPPTNDSGGPLRACLKSFDKNGGVGDNRKKQAGAGENASIPK